ncbi:uncharacterized protein EV420DRAFT_588730 [Desarmillaria tabescens]|uniref:Zn(2)-C6 fungal-type domain-containing protein n=1 Tax=Armillaria tabescens TaxID=1929756 RepID=A0AA39K6J4_ARMTA|nr:uncharacterized protein EV420DRAFT_588730 [Desarmillaria tabescens]KAK0455213.1 hypothetical protein EV420DRAFT_588730 [Desarmillaria tabescens]
MPKAAASLARGSACLCCRKRKLKCDGGRPVCRQCTKMNRAEECEYDDMTVKSRTQKLQEKLTMLETRLRELESEPSRSSQSSSAETSPEAGPSTSPPSAVLAPFAPAAITDADPSSLPTTFQDFSAFDPSWSTNSPSSSSSSVELAAFPGVFGEGSTDHLWPSVTASSSQVAPFLEGNDTLGSGFEINPGMYPVSTHADPNFSASFFPQWDPKTPLPNEHRTILMNIFLLHRHQFSFEGDISRFDDSVPANLFRPEPHPALLSAIYLLGCHFARSPYYSGLEPIFFNKALSEITLALDSSDRLVDIIETSCLLAVYLYINSRFLEGYCHAFAAARLAVGIGLHQITSEPYDSNTSSQQATVSTIPLPAPRSQEEMRDRIAAFWQVFIVDRCWTIANGLPLALPDGDSHNSRIKTPWPTPPEAGIDPSTYIPLLRAKAVALLERASRIASISNKNDDYWANYNAAEIALKRLSASLPAFLGFEPWRMQAPFIDVDLFAIHSAVHGAMIHLYRDVNEGETQKGMRTILSLIRQLNNDDYEFLEPTLCATWTCVAKEYMRFIHIANQNPGGSDAHSVSIAEQEIVVLISAMKMLSAFFPIAGEHAKKIEQELQQTQGST